MKIKQIIIEDIPLIVPIQYDPPYNVLNDFPACCGAGDGIGNAIVPETIWFLKISAACHIHDFSWKIADPTWDDFNQANMMFLRNLLSIIEGKSNIVMRYLRNNGAMTYYTAVDTAGVDIFKKLKGEVK